MSTRRAILTASFIVGTACLTFAIAPPVAAHDAPRVETEVTHRADGKLEVVHVLQLSAAQRLLHKAGVIASNDVSGLKARAQVALYSAKRFELIADNTTVTLNILGAEIGGGHLYVYQTGQLAALPKTWSARNAILRDLSPRFDNVINVPTLDGIQSIVFSGSDMDAINSTN
jgi:hypothetical protein